MLFMFMAQGGCTGWIINLGSSYCIRCLSERYYVLVFHEKVMWGLTACANMYLSFEAEFLMRTDAKSVSPRPPPTRKSCWFLGVLYAHQVYYWMAVIKLKKIIITIIIEHVLCNLVEVWKSGTHKKKNGLWPSKLDAKKSVTSNCIMI